MSKLIKKRYLKYGLRLGNILTILFIIEYLFFQTLYAFTLMGIDIILLFIFYRNLSCDHCGIHMLEKGVMGTAIPVSTKFLDRCPNCGNPFVDLDKE